MRKRSGLYPHVHVDAAGSGVVSQAGGVLLLETVRASGLDQVRMTTPSGPTVMGPMPRVVATVRVKWPVSEG